ncbi:MAG: TIGR01777 family oxidoreductase [Planctomycetota bacterium]
MSRRFQRSSRLPVPPASLWAWHARPGAFERLAPPWQGVRRVGPHTPLVEGSRAAFRIKAGPLWRTWVARHEDVRPGQGFVDVQEKGPFPAWRHEHRFVVVPGGSQLEDEVTYRLPLGPLGALLGGRFVARSLERAFRWRHATTAADLARHGATSLAPLRILVSGSHGLVGSSLVPFLRAGGHDVIRLVRGTPGADERAWDPAADRLDPSVFEGIDAVVHLAGESIASGRWNEARKRRIRESREHGTRLVAEAMARAPRPPKALVVASAIGLYGSRGDELLDEASTAGSDFLADVVTAWEGAAAPAREVGIRTVHLRFGVILDPRGGALAKMLPAFRLGAGGRVGSGAQWMGWVAHEDVLGGILHALATPSLSGPVVMASPEPVRQKDFAKTLGRVLGRPSFMPLPAFAARLAFGEMADALLLASQRPVPKRLLESGFRFRHAHLETALRHMLGRGAPDTIETPETTSVRRQEPACITTSS